jgi:hypothetical protein
MINWLLCRLGRHTWLYSDWRPFRDRASDLSLGTYPTYRECKHCDTAQEAHTGAPQLEWYNCKKRPNT